MAANASAGLEPGKLNPLAVGVFLSSRNQNPDAAKATEGAQLEKAYEAIHGKRTAAYARFLELSGSNGIK